MACVRKLASLYHGVIFLRVFINSRRRKRFSRGGKNKTGNDRHLKYLNSDFCSLKAGRNSFDTGHYAKYTNKRPHFANYRTVSVVIIAAKVAMPDLMWIGRGETRLRTREGRGAMAGCGVSHLGHEDNLSRTIDHSSRRSIRMAIKEAFFDDVKPLAVCCRKGAQDCPGLWRNSQCNKGFSRTSTYGLKVDMQMNSQVPGTPNSIGGRPVVHVESPRRLKPCGEPIYT
ncbi:hypothetical protein J6590_053497 [Homalodisca vitripennis]|nr:hypothetical protein J6590_053497 [Homalodisca vitripennis]